MTTLTPVDFDPLDPKGAASSSDALVLTPVQYDPTTMSVLTAHKRTAKERFDDNLEEGRRGSLSGAGADALSANLPGSAGAYNRFKNKDEADMYQLRSKEDPWYKADGGLLGKAEAGAATLGGIVGGGMGSPEAWIGPGKNAVARVLFNAGINAATDVPVQILQNEAGTHEGFDPWRVASAAATGALVQGGFEGAGALTKAVTPLVKGAARRAGELVDDVKTRVGEFVDSKSVPAPRELHLTEVAPVLRTVWRLG